MLPLVKESGAQPEAAYIPPEKLANPPEIVKAVYATENSVRSKSYLDYLSYLFKNTQINAVVVDVKDSTGRILKNTDDLINSFHNQNIYVIGRIAVFEDPIFASARPELAVYNATETLDKNKLVLWKDNNGLYWLDPASKDVWDYNISLAKDALYHGFDEINFDYIRFPSDGDIMNAGFPVWDEKTPAQTIIKNFFQYARTRLAGERISADLFGQTTTNHDDMGIGQLLENAFENFDYISPMLYPSHYINGFLGFDNPAEHPYEIINYSLATAQAREGAYLKKLQEIPAQQNQPPEANAAPKTAITEVPNLAKFRPWLQDFNMGADYTSDMVKLEIKATQDALGANYNGFMLWSPSNVYNVIY